MAYYLRRHVGRVREYDGEVSAGRVCETNGKVAVTEQRSESDRRLSVLHAHTPRKQTDQAVRQRMDSGTGEKLGVTYLAAQVDVDIGPREQQLDDSEMVVLHGVEEREDKIEFAVLHKDNPPASKLSQEKHCAQ